MLNIPFLCLVVFGSMEGGEGGREDEVVVVVEEGWGGGGGGKIPDTINRLETEE